MRMILALAACDMHRNGLVVRSPGRPTADDHGRYHYGLAVKEFRQLLETPRQVSLDEIETVFATVFLMIAWEWQFGHSVRHVRTTVIDLLRLQLISDLLLIFPTASTSPSRGTITLGNTPTTLPDQGCERYVLAPGNRYAN
jgi:hypothetical protein